MKPETKQKSKKALEIISFIAIFLLFICSLLCLIARLNGAKFDLFGNRYDVVLTDSMSSKNPTHLDFLENDNNQYKAFDLAISKKLPNPEEIKEHDIVIYTDRYIGTNMHRVVEVDTKYYERITFNYATQTSLNNQKGVSLDKVESSISSNDIRFKTMYITTYSTLEEVDNLNFFVTPRLYTPEVTRVPSNDGGYLTTYKITRDTESPGELKISHRAIYDYSKEIITAVHIDSLAGAIDVDLENDLVPSNDGEPNLLGTYNKQFIYKTRGDAAKDDDGWYSYDELQAFVVGNAPGMGYPIRFMGSNWGGLMFALLALLILIVDIIANRMDKKEAARTAAEPAKKVEEIKPEPTPVTPVPAPKPAEPVKKPEPVVNLTVNTTTIKRDPNTGKEEVVKSSRVVQLKPGDNKTVSNTVDMTNAAPSAQPAKPVQTAAKPTQNTAKPAPAPVKPAAPSNGTVLRKSGNNVPPKGDKK